jgi:SAM-dependent methyltransferase
MKMFFRNLGQLFQQDQAQLQQTQATQVAEAGTRLDGAESRLDGIEPRVDATEQRLDTVESHAATATEELRALRQVLEDGLARVEELLQRRLEEQEAALGQRIEARFTTLEQLQDARLNSLLARVDIVEENLAVQAQTLAAQIVERAREIEASLQEQFQQLDTVVDDRLTQHESAIDERLNHYEGAVDTRIQMHTDAVDTRIEERLRNVELRVDERTVQLTETVNQTFEQRGRGLDLRVDDRLDQLERHLDQRMINFEKGIDQRLYTREKFTDEEMVRHSKDVVARTDVLLQQSEQRIDKLRRAIRLVLEADKDARSKTEQLAAFDQLLTPGKSSATADVMLSSGQSLYDEIVAWKQTATEALQQFTADEQEIVDYILSFSPSDHATADHYARQHLRRFLTTLQRLPPPRSTAARVLELGSEIHFTPALKKFGGYSKIHCANWSELDAGLSQQITLKQSHGKESLTFELNNFNAERDRFPYPDSYFSLVLCCEMLEHLAHDPMHNLWECNRVLEPDGLLLLTTPNLACARSLEGVLLSCQPYLLSQYNLQNSGGQHHREYTPQEVQNALVAAGFTVIALETEDVWAKSNPAVLRMLQQLNFSTDLRGDNIFALARKTHAPRERYPEWLYTGTALTAPAEAATPADDEKTA